MKRLRLWTACAALICSAPIALHADEPADLVTLQRGLAAYASGLDTSERATRLEAFRRAERQFARLLARGHRTADLHANLANAALQTDRLGTAVLHYRRALALAPNHSRSLQNLAHARTLLPEWVPRPRQGGILDSFFFWHRTLSRDVRGLAAACSFALAALGIALSLRLGSGAPRNLALLPLTVWVALLGSLALESAEGPALEAVISAEEVIARAADSKLAPRLLPGALPGGTEVRVVESRQAWLRVRLANGRDVWVPESSTTLITIDLPDVS